jgi:hypothetical protein
LPAGTDEWSIIPARGNPPVRWEHSCSCLFSAFLGSESASSRASDGSRQGRRTQGDGNAGNAGDHRLPAGTTGPTRFRSIVYMQEAHGDRPGARHIRRYERAREDESLVAGIQNGLIRASRRPCSSGISKGSQPECGIPFYSFDIARLRHGSLTVRSGGF